MDVLAKYRKTIAAVAIGLVGWATLVVESASSSVTDTEWIALAVALLTALGVYGIPNQPE